MDQGSLSLHLRNLTWGNSWLRTLQTLNLILSFFAWLSCRPFQRWDLLLGAPDKFARTLRWLSCRWLLPWHLSQQRRSLRKCPQRVRHFVWRCHSPPWPCHPTCPTARHEPWLPNSKEWQLAKVLILSFGDLWPEPLRRSLCRSTRWCQCYTPPCRSLTCRWHTAMIWRMPVWKHQSGAILLPTLHHLEGHLCR